MNDRDWPEELDERIEAVAAADDPYQAAGGIMGTAVDYIATSEVANRLYLIWAAFTDWVELEPSHRETAIRAMVEAAAEWSKVRDDAAKRDAYLDHWEHQILGYERPADER